MSIETERLEEATERVRTELAEIRKILEEITGIVSNWNGVVELVENAGYKGQKPFECGICIDAALAAQDVRWRTLIHESLHAMSAGYNWRDFDTFRGWEEGVVEKLQQVLRPTILSQLGTCLSGEAFRQADANHIYASYVTALEEIRTMAGRTEKEFYISLLRTPIRDRPGSVLRLTEGMRSEARQQFLFVFSKASFLLKRRL